MAISSLELYQSMRQCFGTPPTQAGDRLKSEPALAELLGLKRPTVRKVIDRFVEEGVLVRRHGSGTYVRKVVELGADDEAAVKLDSALLLEAPAAPQARKRPLQSDTRIKIGLIADLSGPHPSGVYRLILDGICRRAIETGNIVEMHPAIKLRRTDRGKEAVQEAILSQEYDGLIVKSEDDFMMEALAAVKHPSVVYLNMASREWSINLKLEPMVSFDLNYAMTGALHCLAVDQGYERVAAICFSHGNHGLDDNREDAFLYNKTLDRYGRVYRRIIFLSMDEQRNRAAIKELVKSPAPQAVYIADDVALKKGLPLLVEAGFKPGKNMAVMTHMNKGVPPPRGYDWTGMEFDPIQVGTLTLDCLLTQIKSSGRDVLSLAHRPRWMEGATHLLTARS